jgi:hypothetical protein
VPYKLSPTNNGEWYDEIEAATEARRLATTPEERRAALARLNAAEKAKRECGWVLPAEPLG